VRRGGKRPTRTLAEGAAAGRVACGSGGLAGAGDDAATLSSVAWAATAGTPGAAAPRFTAMMRGPRWSVAGVADVADAAVTPVRCAPTGAGIAGSRVRRGAVALPLALAVVVRAAAFAAVGGLVFKARLVFAGLAVEGRLVFAGLAVEGRLVFAGLVVEGRLVFAGLAEGRLVFAGLVFKARLVFAGLAVEGRLVFAGLAVEGRLVFTVRLVFAGEGRLVPGRAPWRAFRLPVPWVALDATLSASASRHPAGGSRVQRTKLPGKTRRHRDLHAYHRSPPD
jgi:hypothetical protein